MSQSPPVRVAVSCLMRAEHELKIAAISVERVGRPVYAVRLQELQADLKALRIKVARIKANAQRPEEP